MEKFKEIFIKYLTEDKDPKIASAIFNKKTGIQLWGEVRLDMIMWAYDKAMKEYQEH